MSVGNETNKERSGEPALNLETAWRITDVVALDRTDWRRLCLGSNRVATQQRLLTLVESGAATTRTEHLVLYQAAYAVLPLHGDSLNALARLLVESSPVPLEWADVLVEALAQTPRGTPLATTVLAALRQTLTRTVQLPSSPAERRRAYTVANQLAGLGYRTAWATELAAALAHFPSGQIRAHGKPRTS